MVLLPIFGKDKSFFTVTPGRILRKHVGMDFWVSRNGSEMDKCLVERCGRQVSCWVEV